MNWGTSPGPAADGPDPVTIRQPEKGYRFSIDSVLLSGFAAPHCRGSVLDLGTGCGVLLVLLSRLAPGMVSGTGVEIQRTPCCFAERNFRENGVADRLRAIRADFRDEVPGVARASFDLVVSNPPYGRAGTGRRNPHPEKETARHEVSCSLPELLAVAARSMGSDGKFALILPCGRYPELSGGARREGLRVEETRRVHARIGDPPSRTLFLLAHGGGNLPREMPPLHLHEGGGKYCPEVERICRIFRAGTQPG